MRTIERIDRLDGEQEYPTCREIRTLFISDCHLGSPHARSVELLRFLRSVEPAKIFLVGDIVDGWALRRRWRWTRTETECLRRLFDWARRGIPVLYAAGNHDDFLHPFLDDFGLARLGREFFHTTALGRRYLVVHGDRFDDELGTPGWKSWVGSTGYDALFWMGAKVNQIRRRLGLAPSDFAQRWRNAIPAAQRHLDAWEQVSARHAREHGCDGVICGHVHTPRNRRVDSVDYVNIGDWMENQIALVETADGELRHWSAEVVPQSLVPTRLVWSKSVSPLKTVG